MLIEYKPCSEVELEPVHVLDDIEASLDLTELAGVDREAVHTEEVVVIWGI